MSISCITKIFILIFWKNSCAWSAARVCVFPLGSRPQSPCVSINKSALHLFLSLCWYIYRDFLRLSFCMSDAPLPSSVTGWRPGKRNVTSHLSVVTADCLMTFVSIYCCRWTETPLPACDPGTTGLQKVHPVFVGMTGSRPDVYRLWQVAFVWTGLIQTFPCWCQRTTCEACRGEFLSSPSYLPYFITLFFYFCICILMFDNSSVRWTWGGFLQRWESEPQTLRCFLVCSYWGNPTSYRPSKNVKERELKRLFSTQQILIWTRHVRLL